jgi:MFS family permease
MIRFSPAGAGRVLREYGENLVAFRPNARLYLLNVVIVGAAMGIYRLLFNFYVLSLGYDEAILGNLVTTSSLTALIVALPMGYLADLLGRKKSLLLSGAFIALAVLAMVAWPNKEMLFFCNIISGVAQSLAGVTMAPFLMENSSDKERTYLFSFVSGLQMVSSSIGNWIGGYMPSWIGLYRTVEATSSTAYAGSLVIVAIAAAGAVIPLALLHSPKLAKSERTVFAPITYAMKHPGTLSKLILPMLVTSIGAGLIMPFMNVFFRQVYHASDPVIGSIFA